MRWGRHAESKWDWGTNPSRSDERAAAIAQEDAPSRPTPGKKDKKAHCKAAQGPHQVTKIKRLTYYTCQPALMWNRAHATWDVGWTCYHELKCQACGKVFETRLSDRECPDWRPLTISQREDFDQQIAQRMKARDAWKSRKPVIKGRQAYRRPKKV